MYDAIASLDVTIDTIAFERLEAETSSEFTRVTTTISLIGDGVTGAGEDVTYDAIDHDRLVDCPPAWPIPFTGTLGEFIDQLDAIDLFPESPERAASRHYRRWGIESAALDLALRQADTDLGSIVDEKYDPVRFVVSTRLGDPPTLERIEALASLPAPVELKLDPVDAWTTELIASLAEIDRVRILDLKGAYEGTSVDQPPSKNLYKRVIEAFPGAIIEDPAVTEETAPILDQAHDRIAWDAPIHSVEDIHRQAIEPTYLNMKPSRLGSLRTVFETIAHCRDANIGLYGGGQFELGVGRRHIQALAALFYPDAPNDVAPRGYNAPTLPGALPPSPLDPPASILGFDFG